MGGGEEEEKKKGDEDMSFLQSYLISLGEELGEFRMPPFRCFFWVIVLTAAHLQLEI